MRKRKKRGGFGIGKSPKSVIKRADIRFLITGAVPVLVLAMMVSYSKELALVLLGVDAVYMYLVATFAARRYYKNRM